MKSSPERRYTQRSWQAMKRRCLSPKHKNGWYMKRGITVCQRWMNFENFLSDMGYRPKGLTLDRIDNTKGYFPENCRWATVKQQLQNGSFSMRWIVDGKAYNSGRDAEAETGIPFSSIRYRVLIRDRRFSKELAYKDGGYRLRAKVRELAQPKEKP